MDSSLLNVEEAIKSHRNILINSYEAAAAAASIENWKRNTRNQQNSA